MAGDLSLVAGGAVFARSGPADSSSPRFRGEGDHAQHGGGVLRCAENPSTAFGGPPPQQMLGRIPPSPNCSPRTRAMQAGRGSCWRRSTRPSLCCGCRSGWRSWRAGASIRRACRPAEPHPCRGARCPRRLVGDGGGAEMQRALLRDRRIVGRPARPRLHRDAAACRRCRAVRRGRLFDSAGRPRQSQRRADALADRERGVAAEPARPARAGSARLGRRSVPGAKHAAGTLDALA